MNKFESRRKFLRDVGHLSASVLFAPALAKLSVDSSTYVLKATEDLTGQEAGNAGMKEHLDQICDPSKERNQCVEDYYSQPDFQFSAVVLAPFSEEFLFRMIPAMITSAIDKGNPIVEMGRGTGKVGFSNTEIAIGITSSIMFGLAHNLTNKGFNTKVLPSYQTIVGGVAWVLQRKLGSTSNILYHGAHNYLVLSKALNT